MSWLAPTPHPAARKSLFTSGVNALKLSGPLWHNALKLSGPLCPRRPRPRSGVARSFRPRKPEHRRRRVGRDRQTPLRSRRARPVAAPLSQNHVIRSTKLQRVVTSRVVDDFTQRSRRLRRVHLMSEHKRRIAGALIAVTLLGVVYAVALVEVRLGGLAPVATIDQLRAANLGILALELVLLFEYYRASRSIHLFCSHDPPTSSAGSSSTSRCSPSASSRPASRSTSRTRAPPSCTTSVRRRTRPSTSTARTMGRVSDPARSMGPSRPSCVCASRHRAMGARLLAALRPRTTLVAVPRRGALDVPPQVFVSEAAGARAVCLHRHVLVVLLVLVSRAQALPPARRPARPRLSACNWRDSGFTCSSTTRRD